MTKPTPYLEMMSDTQYPIVSDRLDDQATQHLEMMSDTQYPIWMPTTALDAVMPIRRKRETTGTLQMLARLVAKASEVQGWQGVSHPPCS